MPLRTMSNLRSRKWRNVRLTWTDVSESVGKKLAERTLKLSLCFLPDPAHALS
jgi:hypothetical protein